MTGFKRDLALSSEVNKALKWSLTFGTGLERITNESLTG